MITPNENSADNSTSERPAALPWLDDSIPRLEHEPEIADLLDGAVAALKRARPEYASQTITFVRMNRNADRFKAVTALMTPIPDTECTLRQILAARAARAGVV
jgi:hypothetical protein